MLFILPSMPCKLLFLQCFESKSICNTDLLYKPKTSLKYAMESIFEFPQRIPQKRSVWLYVLINSVEMATKRYKVVKGGSGKMNKTS